MPTPSVAVFVALFALLCPLAVPTPAAQATGTATDADFDSPYFTPTGPQLPVFTQWAPWQSDQAMHNIMQRLHDAGLRWLFVWVPWTEIEPSPDAYRFSEFDRYLVAAHDVGMRVIVQVQIGDWTLPQAWAGPTRTNSAHPGPSAPPVDLSPVVDLWEDLVQRYKPGGDLAVERGWGDAYGVTLWEVDNEPDSILWWANWERVPKDFAEYLSLIVPAVHAIDPRAIVAAPALSEQANNSLASPVTGAPHGIAWLDEMLSEKESEWASDTYRASPIHPAGGPFIEAYSWHRDNVNVEDGSLARRAAEVEAAVLRHANEPHYPTRSHPEYWYTEGSPLSYEANATRFARASAQLAAQLLAAGTDRISLDPGSQQNDQDWSSNPEFLAIRAITRYFPQAGNVQRADADVDPARVTAYKRTDPHSGLATYILWAHDLPQGSTAGPGAPFTVRVPARTATVDLVEKEWSTAVAATAGGAVEVELYRADPSPVVIVAERAA